MDKKITIVLTILITFLFVFSPSCKKEEDSVIKIGAIFSMSGNVAAYGQRSRKGFELAINLLNKKGGINNKKIIPIIEDAKSQPKDALSAFRKLLTVDNVKIIVGDVLSSTTMAIVPLLEKEKVILFAPGASHPELKGASKYFFRNWTSDDFDGAAMAHYIKENGIIETGIFVQKSDYALGLANAFQNRFKSLGGTIKIREEFSTDATDFKVQILKLKSSGISHIYLIGESKENGRILKQSKELDFNPQWYANLTVDTPECQEIAGIARNGVIFSTPAFSIKSDIPEVKEFIIEFKKKYDEIPEATSGHSYDAMMILANVMEKVGTNIDEIINALSNIKNFPGVTGTTTFDKTGDVKKDIFIKQIKNNIVVFLKDFKF